MADHPALTFDEQGFVRMDELAATDPDRVLDHDRLASLRAQLHEDAVPPQLEQEWDDLLAGATDENSTYPVDGAGLDALVPHEPLIVGAEDGPIVLVPTATSGNGTETPSDASSIRFDERSPGHNDWSDGSSDDTSLATSPSRDSLTSFDPVRDEPPVPWADESAIEPVVESFDGDDRFDVDVVELDDPPA